MIFRATPWFLKESFSICTESSAGANTLVSSREGEIYRITPRRNDSVNDSWMPDSGRELYKQVKSEKRITSPIISGEQSSLTEALIAAGDLLRNKKVGVVGSCRSSVEELYLLNKLAKNIKAKKFLRGHFGEDDGILLSADRTPNLRGALATGFFTKYPKESLNDVSVAIRKSQVEALIVVGEELTDSGVTAESLKGVPIVYLGTHRNSTSDLAEVVVPTLKKVDETIVGIIINIEKGFEIPPVK